MNEQHLAYLASPEWAARLEADLLPWIERMVPLGDEVLEIGPGPGLTTDILRKRASTVTVLEIDQDLAAALSDRLVGTNVTVQQGDGRAMRFSADTFSAVTCFSVLHHVPSRREQDLVLTEILRVLRPGAALYATDARDLDPIREGHKGDTFVPLPADSLVARLTGIGFAGIELELAEYEIRFAAHKPIPTGSAIS